MIKIANISVPLAYNQLSLELLASQKLGIDVDRISSLKIINRAVNAQDKTNVHFLMTLIVGIKGDPIKIYKGKKSQGITRDIEVETYSVEAAKLNKRPVIIGSGPAGLFAALIMAEAGVRPILVERGMDVDRRKNKVMAFWETGLLDTENNVQYGEGGAGTFSDGKLKTGKKDARKMKILEALVESGAPEEILYLSKPHIGTDRLHETVKNIREKIIGLGGTVMFGTQMTDIDIEDNQIRAVNCIKAGQPMTIETEHVILAIGHSARDTFQMLYDKGIQMERKNFAVGVRIEHRQDTIDQIQYGKFQGHPALGAADYKMVVHLPNGRAIYTFCMCPGGSVVAATSEEGAVVTNGMSEFARAGRNANTALLVTVSPEDLESDHPLAGISYQRKIETAAYQAGGGDYFAPVQRLEDFLMRRNTAAFGRVIPTYEPGTCFNEVDSYLPDYLADSLREALVEMGEWMPGFLDPDAILTGAETRSASPVRILRDETLQAVGVRGLFPCGEGAGYAGGIVSAAVDGLLCAESVMATSRRA